LNSLDVGGAAKDVAVLWFAQPAPLTISLAGLAAFGLKTKPLMMAIPAMRQEQLFAMEALTL
jgi:hypothetical protein